MQAAELLVQSYKRLRGADAQGDASAYRITVRQLEALVRLSEALARLHATSTITVNHVKMVRAPFPSSTLPCHAPSEQSRKVAPDHLDQCTSHVSTRQGFSVCAAVTCTRSSP